MGKNIKEIISQMSLEEKASLCSGLDFWYTKPIDRLGISSIMVTDGPHGLRKQVDESDHIGINASEPATCFPTGAALASSWDRNLIKKIGVALGEECHSEGVSILLGPGVNIKRSPICGRNFEYYSEDPYLSSEIAKSHIMGVQSQGIGTSLKHFAVNNQEHGRFSISVKIDDRTLREIYLASFEGAVKEAQPWTIMCSYNKVNGVYCSENEYLLNTILRDEWGFEGFVMSDWGAVNEIFDGIKAGLELEMPSSYGIGDKKIVEAVKNGNLSEKLLDRAVERILNIVFKAADNKKQNIKYDKEFHHKLARKVASECMVLLKNEENILPLKKTGNIAVIGAFAKTPRYQGGGSSHINPTKLDNALEEIEKLMDSTAKLIFAGGFDLDSDDVDDKLFEEAKATAIKAETAIIFVGLPDRYESEGYDRVHMRIPENQILLIEAIAKVQKNIVVVLSNGSPVEMPWIDNVKGLFEAYLGGQASGGAIADLLFGDANPCGKLAETFPKKLSDNPSYLNFPGEGDLVEYREGIFVGYRYYDKKEMDVLFPFGHGLSYTNFEYLDIFLDNNEILDNEKLEVKVKVKNTGKMVGKEIIQLYIKDVQSSVIRPEKELKGFEKIELNPGEEKTVTFILDKRAFAYYNVDLKDWYVESGVFEVLVGSSSKNIILKADIKVNSTKKIKKQYTRNSTLGEIAGHPIADKVFKQIYAYIFGKDNTTDEHLGMDSVDMLKHMLLRTIVSFSKGKFTEDMLQDLLKQINEDEL